MWSLGLEAFSSQVKIVRWSLPAERSLDGAVPSLVSCRSFLQNCGAALESADGLVPVQVIRDVSAHRSQVRLWSEIKNVSNSKLQFLSSGGLRFVCGNKAAAVTAAATAAAAAGVGVLSRPRVTAAVQPSRPQPQAAGAPTRRCRPPAASPSPVLLPPAAEPVDDAASAQRPTTLSCGGGGGCSRARGAPPREWPLRAQPPVPRRAPRTQL